MNFPTNIQCMVKNCNPQETIYESNCQNTSLNTTLPKHCIPYYEF